MSSTFPSAQVQAFMRHPSDGKMWLAGVSGGVFRTADGGRTWREVLKLRSMRSEIREITLASPAIADIFAVTAEGVYRSRDKGAHWERVYGSVDRDSAAARTARASDEDPGRILVGTDSGLFVTRDGGHSWNEAALYRSQKIHQIDWDVKRRVFWVGASDGVTQYDPLEDKSASLLPFAKESAGGEAAAEDTGSAQFEVESIHLTPSSAVQFFRLGPAGGEKWCILRGEQAYESMDGGTTWRSAPAMLAGSAGDKYSVMDEAQEKVFVQTSTGISLVDFSRKTSEVVGGLPDPEVTDIRYYPDEDALYAATPKGLYRMHHPEFNAVVLRTAALTSDRIESLLGAFGHEPSVLELQGEAIRYAEVHPDKIQAWRKAASRRAWVPTLNTGYDLGADETVDLDRGGTNDPDRFIDGPVERDRSWSVDFSWDLSELIWNDDQTTIDTRSKLMAELREDVLTQLNHLYYARRRLQVLSLVTPQYDVQAAIERAIQIDEYTAGLDALTGGYFSFRMNQIKSSRSVPQQSSREAPSLL